MRELRENARGPAVRHADDCAQRTIEKLQECLEQMQPEDEEEAA